MRAPFYVAAFCALISTSQATAQSLDAFDMFSSVMSLVETKAAGATWEKLDQPTIACMRAALKRQGTTVEHLIGSGVTASDTRLRDLRASCEGKEPDTASRTSRALDDIEEALAGRGQVEAARQQEEQELVTLRDEALNLAGAEGSQDAALAIVRQIDTALADPRDRGAIATIRYRLAQLEQTADDRRAWNTLSAEARAIADEIEAISYTDLPPGFDSRRGALRIQLDAALAPPAVQLLTYGLPTGDCTDQSNPIGVLICENDDARWTVLENSRAYYLMRFLEPDQRESLSASSISFQRKLVEKCAVRAALKSPAKRSKATQCVEAGFSEETRRLVREVKRIGTREATEELERPISLHLQLQRELVELAYLPPAAEVDGIYGAQTRAAIRQLQTEADLPSTGVMSDQAASHLKASAAASRPPDRGAVIALEAVVGKYRAFKSELDEAQRLAEAERKQKQERDERVAQARKLLGGYLSEELRGFLLDYVSAGTRSVLDAREMERLDALYVTKSPELGRARQLNAALAPEGRLLLDNDGGYVILFNAGPTAPSVGKGLGGDLVFSGDKILACSILPEAPDRLVSGQLRQAFSAIGADVRLPLQACNLKALDGYDLVLFSNGEQVFEPLLALLAKLKEGTFERASILTAGNIAAAKSQRAERVRDIQGFVKAGQSGFAYLALDNESHAICVVTPDEREAHGRILNADAALVEDELGGAPDYLEQTADEAFIAAKRHKCGAVYASAVDLTALAPAFTRDGVKYSYWPFWHDDAVLKAAREEVALEKQRQLEREADAARKLNDAQAIAEAKAADADLALQRRQASLRQKYGAAATAFELRLADELSAFLTASASGRQFADKYPAVAAEYQSYLADGWELVDHRTELADFGTAEFKSRRLELGVGRSSIKLRNRTLGEYKELCYITAYINDAEFAVDRDQFGMSCVESAKRLDAYKVGERFESLWVAQ